MRRRSASELETDARVEVLVRVLNAQIPTLRLSALLDSSDRPEPYCEAAVTDLAVDDEKLVAMREFELDGSLLERRGEAFMMTPSGGVTKCRLLVSSAGRKARPDPICERTP